MADSGDDSVVAITSDEEGDSFSEKPIIKLFKRLIDNDTKQNTVLTNNQILDLLKVEFEIDLHQLHGLEVDIYINLMKKFLKDWPQWPEFDSVVSEAKRTNNRSLITKMLQEKHTDLKKYLQNVIDVAQPLAKEAVEKAKSHAKEMPREESTSDVSVLLEVHANRSQLNNLFLRRPIQNSVFNMKIEPNRKIIVTNLKPAVILNWWNVNLELKMCVNNSVTTVYKREMIHELKHTLVNKKLGQNDPLTELDQELNVKQCKNSTEIDNSKLINYVDKVAAKANDDEREILKFIKKDLFLMPNRMLTLSMYKRYLNPYSYVRYLSIDDTSVPLDDKYDIHLEEVLMPFLKIYIGSFDMTDPSMDNHNLSVECTSCSETFSGPVFLTDLNIHFQNHVSEPPVVCTKCKTEYSMLALAETWWCHRCQT